MPGPVVADRQLAAAQRHLDHPARAGSTWPRCRAGWRPPARARRDAARRPLVELGAERTSGAWRRARSTRRLAHEVEPHVLGLGALGGRRGRARPGRRRARVSSSSCCGHVARARCSRSAGRHRVVAREHLDVRAQARERRAQLVRGVGDELALRPRRVLERLEHRVERRRRAARARRCPDASIRAREVVGLGHVLGRLA